MHFGFTLRLMRTTAGLSLRDLAARVGVSSAYISRIEHGHDPVPTPDRLVSIARSLGVSPGVLFGLVEESRITLDAYVRKVPEAKELFLEIARRDLSASQLARMHAYLRQEFDEQVDPAPPISQLLSERRVLLRLACHDLAEAVAIGARRFDLSPEMTEALIEGVLQRERAGSSSVGNGLSVPNWFSRGIAPAVVLITLSRPLREVTPDGRPITVLLLTIGPADRGNLPLLARAARLAEPQFIGALKSAQHPRTALAILHKYERG